MLIASQNTLVTIAADLEWPHFEPKLTSWRLLKTGIGKVNALTEILNAYKKQPFDVLVNLGSVGSNSKTFQIGEIVQVTKVLEHDNPFSRGAVELPQLKSPKVRTATLGTGDCFVTARNLPPPEIELVDMESYAIARLAATFSLQCLVLKIVSDYCTSFADWEKNVGPNSKELAEFFSKNKFEI